MLDRFRRLPEGMQGFVVATTLGVIVFGILLMLRHLN
jgi:hypothetical protein